MKKYTIAMKILGVCLLLAIGIVAGIEIQKLQTERAAEYADSLSTEVAVVNQDLGAAVNGNIVNYANAVIETLGSEYKVVSASVAQSGYESGVYGAIVTFPADFSANITSINNKVPKQAMLGLSINPKLPEEHYIPLYTQLVDMQNHVNNSIAYAYVQTVYEQLHSAQDEIKELFANDETDMEAVKKVSLTNYTEMLNLGDMPMVSFDPSSPDFDKYTNYVQSIADDMNKVYVDSYAAAQANFDVIKGQISGYESEIDTHGTKWTADLTAWSDELSAYALNVAGYKQALDGWRASAEAFISDERLYDAEVASFAANVQAYLTGQLTGINTYRGNVQLWEDEALGLLHDAGTDVAAIKTDAESLNAKATELDGTINTYNAELTNLSEWFTFLQEYQLYVSDPSTYGEPVWPSTPLPQALSTLAVSNDISVITSDMNTMLANLQTAIVTEISAAPEPYALSAAPELTATAPTFVDEIPTSLATAPAQTAPEQPQELADALTGIVAASSQYNPEDYLNDETKEDAQESVDEFYRRMGEMDSALKSNDASNLAQLNSIYAKYNTHIGELRMNIYDVHNKEQANLATSISGLTETLTHTSVLNHGLMDSFVSKMPNSRINSVVNTKVVEDTVEPVSYSFTYFKDIGTNEQVNISLIIALLILVLILAIAVDAILIWRKTKATREDRYS